MYNSSFSAGPYAGVSTPSGAVYFPERLTLVDARPHMDAQSAPVLGLDGQLNPVAVDLENDSPHVLVNAGTGGGKSVVARSLLAQHVARGGLGIVLDYKQVSQRWTFGLEPNIRVATSLPDIGSALYELGQEVHRRNSIARDFQGPVEDAPVGPPIMVVFEELNATIGQLKALDKKLPKDAYTGMDGFMDLMFMGRAARMHVVATTQLASWRAMGGAEILANFNCKVMLRYDDTAWRWVVGQGVPYRVAPHQPGRGMVCQASKARETQLLYMTECEARKLVLRSPHALRTAYVVVGTKLPQVWKDAERDLT